MKSDITSIILYNDFMNIKLGDSLNDVLCKIENDYHIENNYKHKWSVVLVDNFQFSFSNKKFEYGSINVFEDTKLDYFDENLNGNITLKNFINNILKYELEFRLKNVNRSIQIDLIFSNGATFHFMKNELDWNLEKIVWGLKD